MPDMRSCLSPQEKTVSFKTLVLLLIIAYLFSIAVRMIWVYHAEGFEQNYWNGELMINTNDGYFFAEGARDIINGHHEPNDLSPIHQPLSKLTAFLASVLPISFETLILYMPSFLGSLLVIPILLIGRSLKLEYAGFVGALLGGITLSYYNRTMVGYYDTDMLIVVLPALMLWGTVHTLIHQQHHYLVIAPMFALLAVHWHPGTINIVHATLFMTIIYTVALERKNPFFYKFIALFALALLAISLDTKLVLLFAGALLFYLLKEKLTPMAFTVIAVASMLLYLFFGGAEWVGGVFRNIYLLRAEEVEVMAPLHYFSVINTVREAGHIPFEVFASRISGHPVTFFVALIGYGLLLWRFKILLLTLPMSGLGFFALQGGLRFTVFAVPMMALGLGYIIYLTAQFIKEYSTFKLRTYLGHGISAVLFLLTLYPNIIHIVAYKVPTVFTQKEVTTLDQLKTIAQREDYVISWWDYGYPIRYYADVKTLIDGGKHSGDVNYPVSYILTQPQVEAAAMARLNVEYLEKGYTKGFNGADITSIMKAQGFAAPNLFLDALSVGDLKMPEKSRDIYLYLPLRMMDIYSTVAAFSHLDLITGTPYRRAFLYQTQRFQTRGTVLDMGSGVTFDQSRGTVTVGQKTVALGRFVRTKHDPNGQLKVDQFPMHPTSPYVLVHMANYNRILLMEKEIFESTYMQLFVLENYDPELYEPVIMTPLAKVYRLKK
jgi:dolichyl-diphosphooligosaccharide--protein glycosyltransferase/undecaprenyl-diphosphooligosaccharide--protein glycosyltransferase